MKRIRSLAVLAIGALLLSGCAATASTNTSQGQTLKLGLINPLTGAVSWAGIPISQGAQTAVEQINSTHYLGNDKLELTSSDSKGDSATAISLFRGFNESGYLAVGCCSVSTEAGPFAQLAPSSTLPSVVMGATLPGLNNPPYLYRTLVLPDDPGGMYEQTAKAIVANKHVKNAVIVQTADNDGNVADAKKWTQDLESDGVKIEKTVDVFQADTDFSTAVSNIKALNPQLVVFSTQGPATATMIKELRGEGFKGLATSSYGVAVSSVWAIGGPALAGTIFPTPFSAQGTAKITKSFVAAYHKKYKADPDLFSAEGYNAIWFLAQGIKAAGKNVTRVSLGKALSKVKQFELVSGNKVTMDDGQAKLDSKVVIAQWNKDGTQSLWP